MSDRHLYRAKRTDNGEWVEGHLITDEQNKDKCFIGYVFGTNDDGTPHDFDIAPVDPSTICQCTGILDKNGNLIYENDIVSCEHEKFQKGDPVEQYPFPYTIKYKRNYVVEFTNTGSNYGYRLRNKSIHFMLTGNVVYNHKIEVISNIFDKGSEDIGKGAEED